MREVFNSDSAFYNGSNMGNDGVVQTEEVSWMGHKQSVVLTLPPLGMLILHPQQES